MGEGSAEANRCRTLWIIVAGFRSCSSASVEITFTEIQARTDMPEQKYVILPGPVLRAGV